MIPATIVAAVAKRMLRGWAWSESGKATMMKIVGPTDGTTNGSLAITATAQRSAVRTVATIKM